MTQRRYEYGVIVDNCLLQNKRTALLGTVVKIEGICEGDIDSLMVKFLKDDMKTWESVKFTCPRKLIALVGEELWSFLAAVTSPLERVKLATDRERSDRLMQLCKDVVVGFRDASSNTVLLGTIRFIGPIKGIGQGYGIQLHEKKAENRCDGSCMGISYFNCLPGYGIFTTIEQILPRSLIGKKLPEIRSSRSLQNILDSTNTTNDFDQNTILQPDSTYLVRESRKEINLLANDRYKSEIDLIDAIGGSWAGSTDKNELDSFANLKKQLNTNGLMKNGKSKSLVNGSKTVPRKTKFAVSDKRNGESETGPRSHHHRKMSCGYDDDEEDTIYNHIPVTVVELSRRNVGLCNKREAVHHSEKPPPPPTIHYEPPAPGTTNDLTIGTLVEILNDVTDKPLYGVVRWLGAEATTKRVLIGVELEEEQLHLPLTLTAGTHNGRQYFECPDNRAIFVPLNQCHKDSRFVEGAAASPPYFSPDKMFGKEDSPVIVGDVPPLMMPTEEDVAAVCGQRRGIQGHHNSCYLDATLFAMFTFTSVFDSLLYRPKTSGDIDYYEEVQRVLREEIVNPLRKNLYVRADKVMNLRRLLDRLSSVSGLTSEEKDPEEFLHSLLAQILKADPFLKLSSGHEAYHYQLFVEKDDGLSLPTVQQLVEQSFLAGDIKLKEVPACLIIQMPRFGKNYKMYPRILPSQLLDVTDIIENSPRQCTVCGKLARWECKQCFGECEVGLASTAFCAPCLEKAHSHSRRAAHTPQRLSVPSDYSMMEEHCNPPRLFMELFAVICIETSHYVAFVKCGCGHEAPWCFFDSMADRRGEQNGYNIPEMVACPDVSRWLSDEQACRTLHESSPHDRHLPEHARRLLCDAYICMYQSPDVMMYR